MNESVNRISRIQSLINKDLESVDNRSHAGQSAVQATKQSVSPSSPGQSSLEQERKGFEHYQLAQKARQQRRHVQQARLRADEVKQAEQQKQIQTREKLQRDHEKEAREKRRQRFRQGTRKDSGLAGRDEPSSDVLLLTQLVQKGQTTASLSRFDPRHYSPFPHRKAIVSGRRRTYGLSPILWLLTFIVAPFFLLLRAVLSPYYYVFGRSIGSFGSKVPSSARQHFSRFFLCLWRFATAPLHMLAHAVIDPSGIFTRKPHNYARMPVGVYARIFTRQTLSSIRSIPRLLTMVGQGLFFFLLAPLLLLLRVGYFPYRHLRQGALRILSSGVLGRLGWFYRRSRIRTTRVAQSIWHRIATSSGAQRIVLQGYVGQVLHGSTGLLQRLYEISKRGIASVYRRLVALLKRRMFFWDAVVRQASPVYEWFASARAKAGRQKTPPRKVEAQEELQASLKTLPDSPLATGGDERGGLLSETEDTGLEGFLATNVDATGTGLFGSGTALQGSAGRAAVKHEAAGTAGLAKEAIYKEMDEIRYRLRSHERSDKPSNEGVASEKQEGKDRKVEQVQGEGNDKGNNKNEAKSKDNDKAAAEQLFEDVDGLDEDTRARLLERLSKRLEDNKLR